MNVQPEFYRNKKHVVSKFVRASLLPLLGVAPGRGAGEARIADLRLDFAVFMQWLIPLRRRSDKGADIVVLAASPYEKLERHVRRLSRYIAHLDARCGLLTNGGELRVYEKLPDDSVELVLQCTTDEISSRADDIRRMLKTEFPAEEESGAETDASEELPERLEAAVLPESDDVEDDEKPSVSVELPAETPAGMPAELPGDVPDVLPDVPAEPPAQDVA